MTGPYSNWLAKRKWFSDNKKSSPKPPPPSSQPPSSLGQYSERTLDRADDIYYQRTGRNPSQSNLSTDAEYKKICRELEGR